MASWRFKRLDPTSKWWQHVADQAVSALLIAAIFIIIVIAFRSGIMRGDDSRLVPSASGQYVNAFCAILSKEKYGTGRYVCASAGLENMDSVGLLPKQTTATPTSATGAIDDWANDTFALNSALRRVFSMHPGHWDGRLHATGWGSDAGYMDFVDLAFAVFGPKIEALYLGFFLLLTASTVLVCVQFSRNLFPLFTILMFHYALLSFENSELNGFLLLGINNPRLLDLLAVVPLFHVLFLVIYRVAPSSRAVLLVFPQAALMFAAGDFRTLAYWTLIALVVCYTVLVVFSTWHIRTAMRAALMRGWPVLTVFVVVGAGEFWAAAAMDPQGVETGGMRRHTFWEPLYYNLQLHPDWKQKYSAQHDGATGDATAVVAAQHYRERYQLLENKDDYLEGDKARALTQVALEKYIRAAYFEFIRNDPWYFVELKYYNARQIVTVTTTVVGRLWSRPANRLRLFAACVALVLVFQIRRGTESLGQLTAGTGAVLATAILATVPIWATVVNIDLMADLVICTMVASLILPLYFLTALGVLIATRLLPRVTQLPHLGERLIAIEGNAVPEARQRISAPSRRPAAAVPGKPHHVARLFGL